MQTPTSPAFRAPPAGLANVRTSSPDSCRMPSSVPESKKIIQEGLLNHTVLFELRTTGKQYVLRYPKGLSERQETEKLITADFTGSGAFDAGLSYRLRSLSEQATFMNLLHDRGIPALRHLGCDGDMMVLPYLQGETLSQYVKAPLSSQKKEVLEAALSGLFRAHHQGICFGDRWCANTMIRPDSTVVEFDFDVEIIGDRKVASNFEIAQTVYHLLHFANTQRHEMAVALGEILKAFNIASPSQTKNFIKGFTQHYFDLFARRGELLEGLAPPREDQIEVLTKTLER